MTLYAKIDEQNLIVEYPLSSYDLRRAMPLVSFPKGDIQDPPLPFVRVQDAAPPAYDPEAEELVEGTPQYAGGLWSRAWAVLPLSQEALAEKAQAAYANTLASLTGAVQDLLNGKAQEKGYDDIVSACSYAAVPNVFQSESQAYLVWRASVWAKCYEILGEVQQGLRAVPSEAELLAELPVLELPV